MNNSQNENKPLTAEGILDDLYKRVFANINDDIAWDSALREIEEYAAQEAKQVTEERHKAVELLKTMNHHFSEYGVSPSLWSVACEMLTFINSLNASISDTGKK